MRNPADIIVLRKALEEFNNWSQQQLMERQESDKIIKPLYHYTNAAGLKGIIESQQIWFTSYLHLNDPSEFVYGREIALQVLKEIGDKSSEVIRLFCNTIIDTFTHENFNNTFAFLVASFSQKPDDLGQWRAYGDNGRGFALGLAPHLFQPEEKSNILPYEKVFIGRVAYGDEVARKRYQHAIEKAVSIIDNTYKVTSELQNNTTGRRLFLQHMSASLIASLLIWNSLILKHGAYEHEEEVRLIMMNRHKELTPYIETRIRNGEIVPFVRKYELPVHKANSITEIVIGPSAIKNTEDGVCALLQQFYQEPDKLIRKSKIPYKAL